MTHRLDPLLRPASVAVIGASARSDSMGDWALRNLERGGFDGEICLVNPNHNRIGERACWPDVAALPIKPDLAIFAVGDARVERALDEVIAVGIPAAVIMSSLVLDDDAEPSLTERVRQKVSAAGLLLCGANGMGFYNVRDRVWACGFDSSHHPGPGSMALISHSGAGMSGLIDSDQRLSVNVAISTGNELGVTMDAYLDFVLDLPETRVVGLFIETARDPQGFRAALAKAAGKKIPVVALKVGRTPRSAELTVSHSGAMAGDDATYDALFDRYGVQRVSDMDELATAMILFAHCHPLGPGGLATLHDSGGERQLLVDLAESAGVTLNDISDETAASLRAVLAPELPAVNPLDAWSRGGPGAPAVMAESLAILMSDPTTAIGAVVHDRAPEGRVYDSYLGYLRHAQLHTSKPMVLVSARQGTGADEQVVSSTLEGLPVLDGVAPFLRGVRALFAYRDFLQSAADVAEVATAEVDSTLRGNGVLTELESLQRLADAGLPVSECRLASDAGSVVKTAASLGYPLVLKTAAHGVHHKSDVGGVVTGIADEKQLLTAFRKIEQHLGPAVTLAPMAPPGVEMLLGARRDPQFGPVIIVGFGGIHAELLRDALHLLPPFSAASLRKKLDRLRFRPLLDGQRGQPSADVKAFCETAARFSDVVWRWRDGLQEIDANPTLVHESGCTIVDALIVCREADPI